MSQRPRPMLISFKYHIFDIYELNIGRKPIFYFYYPVKLQRIQLKVLRVYILYNLGTLSFQIRLKIRGQSLFQMPIDFFAACSDYFFVEVLLKPLLSFRIFNQKMIRKSLNHRLVRVAPMIHNFCGDFIDAVKIRFRVRLEYHDLIFHIFFSKLHYRVGNFNNLLRIKQLLFSQLFDSSRIQITSLRNNWVKFVCSQGGDQ